MSESLKPRILAVIPGLIPSTLVNIATPLVDLHRAGKLDARVVLEASSQLAALDRCDLVVFCRNVEPRYARWLAAVLKNGRPYIYDIDDNFFEISPQSSLGQYYRDAGRLHLLEEYLRRASLVRVYSDPMFERAQALNPHVVRVDGPVDWRLLSPRPQASSSAVKIVYATSRVDDTLAAMFKPALLRLLEKYRQRIQIHFLGYNPREFKSYSNVFFKPLTLDYRRYMAYLSGAGFDIGLAPLLDDEFHRSKTNVKVREYGACRIAGVYSNVDLYSRCISDRATGLLVGTDPDEWFAAVSELIEDPGLRTSIQEQAYLYVRQNFSHEAFNETWFQQIRGALVSPRSVPLQGEQSASLNPYAAAGPGALMREVAGLGTDASKPSGGAPWWAVIARKLRTLRAGLKAEGPGFVVRMLRFYAETYWLLAQIRFQLL